jgi:CheY-like chemotaxis protein
MEELKILFIEDDEECRRVLEKALIQAGYIVHVEVKLESAYEHLLQILKEHEEVDTIVGIYHLIIMSCHVHLHAASIGFITSIRHHEKLRDIPIIGKFS